MRVGLYAPVGNNDAGRGRFVTSLVRGLYEINSEDVEYVIITDPEFGDWATRFEDRNMTVVAYPWESTLDRVKSALRPLVPYLEPFLLPVIRRMRKMKGREDISVQAAGDFYDSLDLDVIHWTARYWERSDTPMVYSLGDLQDRHYPENFDEYTRLWRDTFCQLGSRKADAIIASSQFVADDIVQEYGVNSEKIEVIYRGPPTQYDELAIPINELCDRFGIEPGFAFYPAKKWIHKNHERLLESLAEVKRKWDIDVPLVCTGSHSPKNRFRELRQVEERLGISDLVHWLGFVEPDELFGLYRASGFLVFPSLFEGQGFPLVEAFDMDTAVACSDIPPFREYGGKAPTYFNPKSVSEMKDVIHRLYTDDEYRSELERASRERSTKYNWEDTARQYQQVYRSISTS